MAIKKKTTESVKNKRSIKKKSFEKVLQLNLERF